MSNHIKQAYIEKVIASGLPTLLLGEAGSGKSTCIVKAADKAGVPYSFLAGSKQVSLGAILGFISVSGVYIPSVFRRAYEEGHYFNIDEIDGMDANVLLVFNSLEQGKMAWPDGYNKPPHENFRLIATANPQEEHSIYVGRSKLDFSTMDRFYKITLERDPELEVRLTSPETVVEVNAVRTFLKAQGSSIRATMRTTLRVHLLKELGLDEYPVIEAVFHSDRSLGEQYKGQIAEATKQAEALARKEAEAKLTQHQVDTFNEFAKKIFN